MRYKPKGPNEIKILPDGTIEIFLTMCQKAIVDMNDYDLIKNYRWQSLKSNRVYYAVTTDRSGFKKTAILMHTLILGRKPGFICDHKDSNGLNNKKDNLRFATICQNSRNRRKHLNTKNKFKGCWILPSGHWQASICVNYVKKNIGVYNTEKEAADAYNTAAIKYFGEYALLDIQKN